LTPVAIIAGRGELPERLARVRAERGLPSLIVAFPGFEADWMSGHDVQRHEFERAGALLRGLKSADVTHVVFAGAMERPKLRYWRADWTALKLAFRATTLLRHGDDAMLRGFGAIFEDWGMSLIGADEILGGEIKLRPGPLGDLSPSALDLSDARRAAQIVDALGDLDIGQGAVVASGLCLGIETLGGTDHMLSGIAALPAERRRITPPPSGVLYKGPKPGQDRRVDMPTIGVGTVEAVARAGLAGIVGAAGETQLMDPEATRAAANRLGLFVFGAQPRDLAG